MKLKASDRIVILSILPTRGNFTTMTLRAELISKIKITQEEIRELEITENDGVIKWNESKDEAKEFELTELELKIIKDTLTDLDNRSQLTEETYNLLKLF